MTTRRAPKPSRPLGAEGLKLWKRIWGMRVHWVSEDLDKDHVLVLCESMDERVGLRVRVLRDPEDWRSRNQLRALDEQINTMMGALALNPAQRKALAFGEQEVKGRLAELRAVRDAQSA